VALLAAEHLDAAGFDGADGNVVVTGSLRGSGPIEFGGLSVTGPAETGFVAELDGNGVPAWARTVVALDASSCGTGSPSGSRSTARAMSS
jgi:hypothetical protein